MDIDRYGDKRPVWQDIDLRTATCAIISTDNFGRDDPDERLFCLCWCGKEDAERMADVHNSEHASRFYKVVALDYVMQPGFRP